MRLVEYAIDPDNGEQVETFRQIDDLKPSTPNNPYFGKKALDTKDFYALVGQTLSADRLKRMLGDSHFLWVGKVLDHVDTVDPDDKAGQFLQIITYLVATNGDDAAKLMTTTERDTIMTAWPPA